MTLFLENGDILTLNRNAPDLKPLKFVLGLKMEISTGKKVFYARKMPLKGPHRKLLTGPFSLNPVLPGNPYLCTSSQLALTKQRSSYKTFATANTNKMLYWSTPGDTF